MRGGLQYHLMMNTLVILSFCVVTVLTHTSALKCYKHITADGLQFMGNDNWETMTCEIGVTACASTLTTEGNLTTRSYGCAYRNQCHNIAHGTLSSVLIQHCCYTDLCNNGTNPAFEDGEDYCYTAQCDHEGCLSELIEFMNTREHGSFCKAGDNGCQMMKRKELTEAGTWRLLEYIGCADPHPCVAMNTKTDKEQMDRQCCNGHLCTDGNSTAYEPEGDSCYEYYCLSSDKDNCQPPTDLSEAVKQGRATMCPMTDKGCYYYEGYGRTKAHYEFATGCFKDGFMTLDECAPTITNFGDVTAKIQCCATDRCNSFIAQHNNTKQEQCYSMTCVGEHCLERAKNTGDYWLCDKTQHGCEIGVIKTGLESIFTIGCATSSCKEGDITEVGLNVLECCTDDRCLPQALNMATTTSISMLPCLLTCLSLII